MKIIKPGDLSQLYKPITFKCDRCKCVFKADNTEYKHEYSQREDCDWYEIKCPTCGGWVTMND